MTPPDPSAASPQSSPMTVCITAVGDGTYTVQEQDSDDSSDPSMGAAPASAMAGSDDQQDQPQTAPDIDSALQMAKQLLTAGDSDDGSQDQGDGNAPLAPADAQAAWKQMAAAKSKKPQGM